jgi:hypothetical protein
MIFSELTPFWIESPLPHAPLGFGVTARSLDDAILIIRALDYGRFLPENLPSLRITAGVKIGDLDRPHVVANMGSIAQRGMWYPFVAVGVPLWAEERIAGLCSNSN